MKQGWRFCRAAALVIGMAAGLGQAPQAAAQEAGELPAGIKTSTDIMAEAFRACLAQRITIAHLRHRFPATDSEAGATQDLWEDTWGAGMKTLEQRLESHMPGAWAAKRALMEKELKDLARLEHTGKTVEQAQQYLLRVRNQQRAGEPPPGGKLLASMKSAARETPSLAARNPASSEEDSQPGAFKDGEAKVFSTAGHPKAADLGCTVTLKIPNGWKGGGETRGGDVELWQSDGGQGPLFCLLTRARLDAPPTPPELESYFTEDFMRRMLKNQARELDAFSSREHQGRRLGITRYRMHNPPGSRSAGHGLQYHMVQGRTIVFLDFTAMSMTGEADAAARMKDLEPLAGQILQSLSITP